MNILIEGAGSIGIALGASLISQKQDVSFCKRKTAKSIKENPIERTGIFNHITCQTNEYRVYTDYGIFQKIPLIMYLYVAKQLQINR